VTRAWFHMVASLTRAEDPTFSSAGAVTGVLTIAEIRGISIASLCCQEVADLPGLP
jgi:hypothetical protein